MPPKARQSSRNLAAQEGRIQLAIKALKSGQIPSVRRAATIFEVPRSTLFDRLHGHQYRAESLSPNLRLSQTQEEALLDWIISMDTRGVAPRPTHIAEMAHILLQSGSSTIQPPMGKNWVTNFIARNQAIKSRFAKKYKYQRDKCEDPKVINQWFDQLQAIQLQYGIANEDVYNFNETGFSMGPAATTRVVARSNMPGRPHLIQPDNHQEWVTTIECINSRGWSLPSCIIFKGQRQIEESLLPPDWRIELSANGWTTDEIGIRWLQNIFIPSCASRTVGKYRLLLLDGYGSHLTPAFDKACNDNNIIAICMPPYLSHLLQPLDVGCLGPLKRAYADLVEAKIRLGFDHIDKLDFLKAYPEAHQKVFTPQNIQNGFAAAGILPWDPHRVLNTLNTLPSTPTPRSHGGGSTSSSSIATPYTVRQLQKKASSIRKTLQIQSHSASSPSEMAYVKAFDELVKGCEIALYNAALMADEIRKLRSENANERQKSSRPQHHMASNTDLSTQEAREQISSSNEPASQNVHPASAAMPPLVASKRAPPTCSNCHIRGHTRTRCPYPCN